MKGSMNFLESARLETDENVSGRWREKDGVSIWWRKEKFRRVISVVIL